MFEVIEYLNQEIKDYQTVVISCSGGPDSMCLSSLVGLLVKTKKLKIIIAHVNHKIRKESDAEEEFVKSFAQQNNYIFECCSLNEFKNGDFTEALARQKRYAFLDKVMKKYQANYLLTAHHGDDLIETILMRLTRGSNLNGYIGIRKKTSNANYQILRPLLEVTKEDIIKYNTNHDIKYVIDKSNESITYTRNRYRKIILPFLKKENPQVHLKYLQFSKKLNDYYDFVNDYIRKNNFIENGQININKLSKENDFIKRVCVEKLINEIQKEDILDVNNKQIHDILTIMAKGNKKISLQNDYVCQKEYNYLKITKEKNIDEPYNYVLTKDLITPKFVIKTIKKSAIEDNHVIRLNSCELKLPLLVRNRKNGDKMTIKNLNGSKKVKDILIDEKICQAQRNEIPIVTDSSGVILWLPGIKKSQFCKDKNEKYDIILKHEVKKGER